MGNLKISRENSKEKMVWNVQTKVIEEFKSTPEETMSKNPANDDDDDDYDDDDDAPIGI